MSIPPEEALAALAAAAGAHVEASLRRRYCEAIAAAIERSVCAPGPHCPDRFCPDCIRYGQAQADAALARSLGTMSLPDDMPEG
jgi:hypothetical protein